MKRMSVHIHSSSPWQRWTAEIESEIARFANDLAKKFKHRVRWYVQDLPYWKASGFISARSLKEGELIRREGLKLAKKRQLNIHVDF